ncbi:maltose alpha-D-glucosyltransferase [Oleidesulfovibrio sp.]|uniref:maltose alpha-D-glucosyltransferase n=1 Tax=Oleidesulfovibrio sp. TaxID=2909707 RepID=UPI003A89CECB
MSILIESAELDPQWYKDAIIYELHIKSFHDSDGDGMGDMSGLIDKLDYLQDLGVTALWLLPFYPSPLRDDGYDIADYMSINPDYGSMADFRKLLREAHTRGLRIITELVLNHTSDQHQWFKRARKLPSGSEHRDFYVWSDTQDKYTDARIIFKDFEPSNWSWDPVAKAYYWHRFYHHQPDLNYENPAVHKAMFKVIDYWLDMGVDGVRLDAVPYLYEEEGSNCENLPETHAFLKALRAHIDRKHRGKMLLAEANQWPEDAAQYFGNGDSCHMAFHFPLMPRMFMALEMEDRHPVIDILEQTPDLPAGCQWAIFLRNHDELTLEMVTDEERDYMYRMYARDPRARINLGIRRRLAPLLGNDRRRVELLNVLLFTMPGTPVLYYGDEIGMGDNYYLGDRDGVRTPMQWSADRNAGFSRSNPQRLFLPVVIDPEYHYEAVNVETQQSNKSSLLWWMKRVIAMRRRYTAFSRGDIVFLKPENPKVLAYLRSHGDQHVLVVSNLSRHAQAATLDLSGWEGFWPEEVFSSTRFPAVKQAAYTLTLNPYGYYIFHMRRQETATSLTSLYTPPMLKPVTAARFLDGEIRDTLQRNVLPGYLTRRGLLGQEAVQLREAVILEAVPVGGQGVPSWLLIVEVRYQERQPEWIGMLTSMLSGEAARQVVREAPVHLMCMFGSDGPETALVEAFDESCRCGALLSLATRAQSVKGRHGELVVSTASGARGAIKATCPVDAPAVWKSQIHATSIVCGDRLLFKVYRRMDEGINPDVELLRYLSEETGYRNAPAYMGVVEYKRSRSSGMAVAMLHEFAQAQGDAQEMCRGMVGRFFDRVLAAKAELPSKPRLYARSPVEAAGRPLPEEYRDLLGDVDFAGMQLLGRRIGELHRALAFGPENASFTPEPFSTLYQRSVYQGMQSRMKRALGRLERNLDLLPENTKADALRVLELRGDIADHLREFLARKLDCLKIRVHGYLTLGNILRSGRDYMIVNFEGDTEKSLSERRLKRSPLRDVSDLIRSLHYTVLTVLMREAVLRPEDREYLAPWADLWRIEAAGAFLTAYMECVGGSKLLPDDDKDTQVMLEAFLIEKALGELDAELQAPSGFVGLPLAAIITLMGK